MKTVNDKQILMAADFAGYPLKEAIKEDLESTSSTPSTARSTRRTASRSSISATAAASSTTVRRTSRPSRRCAGADSRMGGGEGKTARHKGMSAAQRLSAAVLAASAGLTLVVSAAAPGPYGACAHITRGEPPGRTCAMMRLAGMGWVRSDFDWIAIERRKGEWNFSHFDKVVSESEAEGVQLLPILGYSVPWANPAHEHLDAWEEYVRRVVTHYGRRLPVLEVWNEQNASGFWKDPNPTNYLALLRRTHETVKKIDPAIRVAFGGTAGVPLEFIEGVYRLGGAKWFDIMNVHPYSHPRRPEGVMDDSLEKLRAVMARYGDADKPVWVTEVGWPTHHTRFSAESELLLAGLRAARPAASVWRMLYVPACRDEEGDGDELVCGLLRDGLPEGSRVEVCHAAELSGRLAKGDVDGIFYPPLSEAYAADSVDAVHEFVKAGGVLVEFGGVPMLYAFRVDAGGVERIDERAATWRDRQRLRIVETAWWKDARYPESISVRPTAAAKGIMAPQKGFNGQRFFLGNLLKPGDEFVPLLSASTNGIEAVAAAVYKFNSDMKGAVVVSGLLGNHGTSSEERQAKMMARALGIAFAEGVEGFFWYEFRQPDVDRFDHESFFGIVRDNFAPKPAYGAYMTFIDARPAGSVQKGGAWRSPDGGTYCPQWTRPDGRKAGMIWTTRAARECKLTFDSPSIEFFDMVGALVRPERTGNVWTLKVSGSPIYFLGGELNPLP